MFTPKVSIIDLNSAGQNSGLFSFVHDLHELLLDPPCSSITDTDVPFQFKCGYVIFILGYKVYCLELYPQLQLRRVKNGSLCQGCLNSATTALKYFHPIPLVDKRIGTPTFWAHKSCRPAALFQGALTLLLGTILVNKLTQA